MCLSVKFTGKEKKAILDKLPDEFWAWKLIAKVGKNYVTGCECHPLYMGVNKFRCNKIQRADLSYIGGTHLFLKKPPEDNVWYPGSLSSATDTNEEKLIRVKVKKQWVKTVGEQAGLLTITASHAIFPKYCGEKK